MKVVINRCFGGFSLSQRATEDLTALGCPGSPGEIERDIDRADPRLVSVVEALGWEANGRFADLEVIEIPDGTQYKIEDYDGMESIHEQHRCWPVNQGSNKK